MDGDNVVGKDEGDTVVGLRDGDVVDGSREGAEDDCEGVGRADGAAVGLVGELVIGLCVGAAVVGFFDVDGVAKDCGRDVGMDDG